MSNGSPTNTLDANEIVEYLNLTNEMGLADLIKYVWEQGYQWGLEIGYEQGNYYSDEIEKDKEILLEKEIIRYIRWPNDKG